MHQRVLNVFQHHPSKVGSNWCQYNLITLSGPFVQHAGTSLVAVLIAMKGMLRSPTHADITQAYAWQHSQWAACSRLAAKFLRRFQWRVQWIQEKQGPVCVCACVYTCIQACVCACYPDVCVCACACVYAHVCMWMCVTAHKIHACCTSAHV